MLYGIAGIIIVVLIVLLLRKHYIDSNNELKVKKDIEISIEKLKKEKEFVEDDLKQKTEALHRAEDAYNKAIINYNNKIIEEKNKIEQKALLRKEELDNDYQILIAAKRELYQRDLLEFQNILDEELNNFIQIYENKINYYKKLSEDKQNEYESVIEPLKNLEKEKEEKTYYCIYLTEDDKKDINFLVKEVSQYIKNKDIIPKLVWNEYVQKNVQLLMKKLNINDSPGIYKITNINTGKCYIGKSTKVRQRLIDHIKGAIGISNIADQKIHHAMIEEGLWNWQFEKICDCEKEDLNEKEKYYINFFNSQVYGYNISKGG